MNIKPKDKVIVSRLFADQVVSTDEGVVISTHTYKNGVEVANVSVNGNGHWVEVDGKKTKVTKV